MVHVDTDAVDQLVGSFNLLVFCHVLRELFEVGVVVDVEEDATTARLTEYVKRTRRYWSLHPSLHAEVSCILPANLVHMSHYGIERQTHVPDVTYYDLTSFLPGNTKWS